MKFVSITKEVPVIASYDVVVCGGGPAGFIAAIAAAREGAKTAIIERYGFFGGMATAGYVAPISVFSYNNKLNIGGIPWEFIQKLTEMGGALVEQPLHNVAFDIELYKLCAQRMIIEAGVDMYMHSTIASIVLEDNRVSSVIIENKNGSEAIEGKCFIDCTGDADIAHMADVPMQKWENHTLQPASLCFTLHGVDTETGPLKRYMHHNQQGVNCHYEPMRDRLIEMADEWKLPTFGGPWLCTLLKPGAVAVNMTRTSANATDNRDFTAAECRLREEVYYIVDILKEHFEEFKNCYVSSIATQLGIRESRHIDGMHVITAEEYISAHKYEDSISRCSHPIDIHATDGEKQVCKFLDEAAYVPYRSLIVQGFPNLIVAGRSLSASKEAFASLRVQASCMGMGQAAGVAAAQSVQSQEKVQDIDIDTLVTRLVDLGAVLE